MKRRGETLAVRCALRNLKFVFFLKEGRGVTSGQAIMSHKATKRFREKVFTEMKRTFMIYG